MKPLCPASIKSEMTKSKQTKRQKEEKINKEVFEPLSKTVKERAVEPEEIEKGLCICEEVSIRLTIGHVEVKDVE